MHIYNNEIQDGLQQAIEGGTSIGFICDIMLEDKHCPQCNHKIIQCDDDSNQCNIGNQSIATEQDEKQTDLYYMNSVLVSAGWNKNDDVFSNAQLWAARKTPVQKPFNYMHDESDIIGHMTASMVVTPDLKVVPDETLEENIPDKFDIVTSSVIYKTWSDIDTRLRVAELIKEIDEGKWSVSMECVFTDFDYALVTPEGTDKVLARTEESSFLTKHLRAYGGSGEYEGYKLGRLLKGFYFSGKGLVEKPANPRSIIFSKDVNPFNANATVNFNNFITLRESVMTKALNEISQVEASAKAEVDDLAQSSTEVETQAQAEETQTEEVQVENTEAYKAEVRVAELEAAMKELSMKYEEAMKKLAEKAMKEEMPVAEKHDDEEEEEKKKAEMKKAEMKKAEIKKAEMKKAEMKKQKAEELEATIAEKDAKIEAMEKQLAELQASVATMTRKALLTQAGISSEAAEELLVKFAEASDEMFQTVIELAKSQAEPVTEELFDGEQEDEVSASELEEAEDVVEPSLAEAGEEPKEVEMSTASEWLRNSVLKLTKNLK